MEVERPPVSVVMPFAGDRAGAEAAVTSLRSLQASGGDELILVDNSRDGVAAAIGQRGPVRVLVSTVEHSPAHARNVGAAAARHDWILFLDADTVPLPGLLESFFEGGVGDAVGAVAGEVLPARAAPTLAARYGTARNFLNQRSHHEHPYRPRASAANLLVRRAAFVQLGGFYEGVRAGEDTDFTWRLQEAGWRLELRPDAAVEHRYRTSVRELRRQWRGYGAGRAWLARRYREFHPEPAVLRALRRASGGRGPGRRNASATDAGNASATDAGNASAAGAGRLERGRFLALDVLLGLEELAGFTLSNRPSADADAAGHVDVVLVAERFPSRGDPLVELAGTLERVRVEAMARPSALEPGAARNIHVDYLEDDGDASRWAAAVAFALRHPLRAMADMMGRPSGAPPLRSIAPAVRRLQRDPRARIHPLAGSDRSAAERMARLAGRTLER